MIEYDEEWIYRVLCQCKGSVAIRATLYAAPSPILALVFRVFHGRMEDILSESEEFAASQTWTAATTVLVLLLAFRTAQAFSRFWEGTSLLHQMRGEWFDAVSCLVTFSRGAVETKPEEVKVFRHTIVRLMSLCHCSALEEIAETDQLVCLDVFGIDHGTLRHLKECKTLHGFNRVECLLHLFQVLIMKSLEDGVLPIAPPILSRVYQTLSRGFVNQLNARKIADTRFPFPYAQLIAALLLLVMILTPLMLASLIHNAVFACVFSFLPVFGMFSINFIAAQLENPFGSDDNDLPLDRFQTEMNSSLLMLLHENADHVPRPSMSCVMDFDHLMAHGRSKRAHSICSMSEWAEIQDIQDDSERSPSPRCKQGPPDVQALPAPVTMTDVHLCLEELEPKIALLSEQVEELGLMLPSWTQVIQSQTLELGNSFGLLQELADHEIITSL